MNLIGGLAGSNAIEVNNDTAIHIGFADELQVMWSLTLSQTSHGFYVSAVQVF